MVLVLVGLGINGANGLTSEALEELRRARVVYVETYTSYVDSGSIRELEARLGKKFVRLSRREVEVEQAPLNHAREERVAFLVPGDPLIATTHVNLLLEARKKGIETRIVHGVSALSALISRSLLQWHKFGASATISFHPSDFPYDVLRRNLAFGLHTLFLLDVDAERGKYMTVGDGIQRLLESEERRGGGILSEESLGIGLARVGLEDCVVKGGSFGELMEEDFGGPPHALIVPGELHFVEEEALAMLGVDEKTLEKWKDKVEELSVVRRAKKYIEKSSRILKALLSSGIENASVREVLSHAAKYAEDARHFLEKADVITSLVAISYCEGILDALRLLGRVSFEW